jgi:precorrin-6A/cobalt-precorrin-6A reductase
VILLLGGTKDARLLFCALRAAFPGEMVAATAVTEYGAQLLREQARAVVIQGAKDAAAFSALIREKGVRVLVDATHPYAERASAEAEQAALLTGIPYIRYERPATAIQPGDGVYFAPDFRAAARAAARLGRRVFLTVGTRHLAEILAELPPDVEVTVRVLPDLESIRTCRELGLSPAEILAIQGPLSARLNAALFAEYGAGVVISKDSGDVGGTPEKVAAARELGLPIVLVRRPAAKKGLDSPALVVEEVRRALKMIDNAKE